MTRAGLPSAPTMLVRSSILSALNAFAIATMTWLIVTDPIFSGSLWPNDIHRVVVSWLGGRTVQNLSGTIVELSWSAVVFRVAGLLMLTFCWHTFRDRGNQFDSTIERSAALANTTRPAFASAALWLIVWFVATSIETTSLLQFLALSTPLWLAVTVALLVCCRPAARTADSVVRTNVADHAARWPFVVVIVAAAIWVATSFWMNERLHAGMLVPHGDSAMYEEHLWNTWHGKGFRSYLDQGLFLGEHIQVIHLLLLPLHMIWPSYLMMELVAGISLAMCVVPIYRITLRHSESPRAAMWLSLAWLLYFPMHFLDIAIDLKTLRPSCYGLPFLLFGIDFAERRRLKSASMSFLIALTTQEDFALVIGSIGAVMWLLSRREVNGMADRAFRRWTIGLTAFSIAWLLLAVLVVIPAFRGGDSVHYARYFGDLGSSPGDLIRTALQRPMKVLGILVSWRTAFYVLVLTVPLGLAPLRRPLVLLAGLLTFTMLSLIQLGNATNSTADNDVASVSLAELPPIPYHHFHAPLLPVIFWAAARSLIHSGSCQTSDPIAVGSGSRQTSDPIAVGSGSRQTSNLHLANSELWRVPLQEVAKDSRARGNDSVVDRARFAFLCALFTAAFGSMMPIGATFWSAESSRGWRNLYVPGPRAEQFANVLAKLPPDARVASTDFVHTRLTHFERSYDYSDYPRAVNNYKPGVPPDTDFIVIDTAHPYSTVRSLSDVRELQTEPDNWEVLSDETNGLFIVLKRKSSTE